MMTPTYEYNARVVRVIDGDTVVLKIDLGFKFEAELVCRVYGVNTPEIAGITRDAGLAAKAANENMLLREAGGVVFTRTYKSGKDKYGRYLADIFYVDAQGVTLKLSEQLIAGGFGKAYLV